MDCEICGQQNAKSTIIMDGQKMLVCNECTSFGKIVQELSVQSAIKSPKNNFGQKQQVRLEPKTNMEDFGFIEGFGKKIMQGRQKKGISIQELALAVFEKESVMHKVEQEKSIPDKKLAKKIENFLQIKILE